MGSRPCESRNDLLNRWVRLKREERSLKLWERPQDPGVLMTIAECERWRKKLCEVMNDKMWRLYEEPLPEAETRYLNDEMNRELKVIRRFEMRIVELGGIDYSRVGIKTPDGDILNTNLNQYQYFGRARMLPGVKELLENERQQRLNTKGLSKKVNREDLMEKVDSEYYGLYDDSEIEKEEQLFESTIGVQEFSAEPNLNPGFIPSDENLKSAIDAIVAGKEQQITVI
ncbi:Cell cycle control protein [Tritrichomonas foetus]|uniref:Cell cycle control protein n=1 Tax=Tritrichomonas foetus TaxID=1144522 RepID=A0A1J4L0E4_9EUKA|nr:Cell cycle control protein [Tritrichomonas foetus]|eukprot:OHT15325.1 Cell cycle control protein [Tritrichomonas foetus]